MKLTGDPDRHLPFDMLAARLGSLHAPPHSGTLALVVVRAAEGRQTPARVVLTPDGGVTGDRWGVKPSRRLVAQVSIMRMDVAELVANGQPVSLAGDNLLVDLDLSRENLPAGSRLRVGGALLEVTPEPHDGCTKFKRRFGEGALALTADPTFHSWRLRGIYGRVVEAGEVGPGDAITVLSRG